MLFRPLHSFLGKCIFSKAFLSNKSFSLSILKEINFNFQLLQYFILPSSFSSNAAYLQTGFIRKCTKVSNQQYMLIIHFSLGACSVMQCNASSSISVDQIKRISFTILLLFQLYLLVFLTFLIKLSPAGIQQCTEGAAMVSTHRAPGVCLSVHMRSREFCLPDVVDLLTGHSSLKVDLRSTINTQCFILI